jgi:hypothetical protein
MLPPRLIVITTFLVPAVSGLAQQAFPDRCPNQMPLPFAPSEQQHPIDKTCGPRGKPTSPANIQLQNSVKNNFCATAGDNRAETFTPPMLIDLQRSTHIPAGHDMEPRDRKALQTLGEGKVIRMKAYLIEAHHADLGSGESVNCNGITEDQNDIHVALGPQPDSKECDSITAEISPHYRPGSWNEIGHFEIFNTSTQKYRVNQRMAARLQAHPYRITGQLFFDASHAPCPCGTSHCGPLRASVWEIHPVYGIEVCKTGAACNENNDADWLAFDSWWKGLAPLQALRAPHKHPWHERTRQR